MVTGRFRRGQFLTLEGCGESLGIEAAIVPGSASGNNTLVLSTLYGGVGTRLLFPAENETGSILQFSKQIMAARGIADSETRECGVTVHLQIPVF